MRFKDKVVVVIGGNSGIGLASALGFAAEGARVVITGREQKTLDAAAAKLGTHGWAVRCDITDLAATERLMREIGERYQRIDVLFVNAGIGAFLPIDQVTEADFDRVIAANYKGPYFTVQKALPLMPAGSAIVLNSSIGRCKGLPGNSVYASTKAALRSMALNFAAELVGRGIRVNSISPGPVETPIINRTQGLPAAAVPDMLQKMRDVVPMKRMGRPEEAARAALFLASDEASFITGVDLFVDGGLASF